MPDYLLALDVATTTGFALFDIHATAAPQPLEVKAGRMPGRPASGVVQLAPGDAEVGYFFAKARDWFDEMLTAHQPVAVVFEAPYVSAGASKMASVKLLGLAAILQMVCHDHAVLKVVPAMNASVRKHFIGFGNGERVKLKAATVARCHQLGWMERDDTDDNRADALAVGDWAVSQRWMQGVRRRARYRSQRKAAAE